MKSKQADQICEILRLEPNGLPATEVARLLGASSENINSRLSKLAAYGVLHKIPGRTESNVHRCTIYRLLETDRPDRGRSSSTPANRWGGSGDSLQRGTESP
jgi:hypothetical protein